MSAQDVGDYYPDPFCEHGISVDEDCLDCREGERSEEELKLLPFEVNTVDLTIAYGGKWKYSRRSGAWECNDGKRRIVGTFSCDCEAKFCSHPTVYYLYGDGVPKLVG